VRAYRAGVVVFALAFIGIGIALIVVTAVRGGGIGYLLGVLFVAAGVGRLYVLTRR
jgi:hypothetical protein